MSNRYTHSIAAALLMLAVSTTANAVIITTGNLFNAGAGSTVDHWGFSLAAAGVIDIDLLSMETNGSDVIDVNGDGEIAFFDPMIYLFTDDGSLDAGDVLATVDDSGATFGDGSIHIFDSFLSIALGAGDYILAVGAFFLDTPDAIDGFKDGDAFYPTTCTNGVNTGGGCTFALNDHGDYQITWTGDLAITSDPGTGDDTEVPEPATLALLGLGLAAFGARRKLAA